MIEKSIAIAMMVLSIHVMIFWPKMIFHGIADWSARKNIPEWLEKPIFSCSICMTPWWGSLFYRLFFWNGVIEWIIVILAATGINALIVWFKSK